VLWIMSPWIIYSSVITASAFLIPIVKIYLALFRVKYLSTC
jgi:hypothetical protein